MSECQKLLNLPKFKDGRTFCPDTFNNKEPNATLNVICKCDQHPEECKNTISVSTDAMEAIRDTFWRNTNCPKECTHITITADKL